jgi:LPXTG-motif cell wall-anchored protein
LAATGVGQIIGIDAAGGPASSCATDGNGQCRVTVNSTSAGSLTLTAVYDAVAGGTERVFADSGQKNWIDQDLPSTGGGAGRIIRIAAASMLLGLLLVLIARRRRAIVAVG